MFNNFKEYFSFTKKELNGLLVFCILIALTALFPTVYSFFVVPETYDYSAFEKEIAAFKASAVRGNNHKYNAYPSEDADESSASAELFVFDPNTLSAEGWESLGLTDRQVKVIQNYVSKGGKFYKKEDLKKIYSITPAIYTRLEPYIDVPSQFRKEDKVQYSGKDQRVYQKVRAVVELNSADSAQLEMLQGIGPAFASRIVRYRNRLGGFYRKEQLREVYGLDSALYQRLQNQITLDPLLIRRVQVNIASSDDFKKHPYLTYKQINAIIKYRQQHGSYKSVQELKSVAILNEEVLSKIEPYLSFDMR